jgi:UDP-glucose 4-epimerase
MARAEDLPGFFRIKADNRDLNYIKFISQGKTMFDLERQYTSHNTERLGIEGMKKQLIRLDLFK